MLLVGVWTTYENIVITQNAFSFYKVSLIVAISKVGIIIQLLAVYPIYRQLVIIQNVYCFYELSSISDTSRIGIIIANF